MPRPRPLIPVLPSRPQSLTTPGPFDRIAPRAEKRAVARPGTGRSRRAELRMTRGICSSRCRRGFHGHTMPFSGRFLTTGGCTRTPTPGMSGAGRCSARFGPSNSPAPEISLQARSKATGMSAIMKDRPRDRSSPAPSHRVGKGKVNHRLLHGRGLTFEVNRRLLEVGEKYRRSRDMPERRASTSPRRRRDAAATRQAILEAATRRFATEGYQRPGPARSPPTPG